MRYLSQSEVFEVVRSSIGTLRARGQIPQLMEQAFYNHAQTLVRIMEPVTPSSARGKYVVRKQGNVAGADGRAIKGRQVAAIQIINTDPAFGTYLTGSATKNVEKPSGPYKIFPKKSGGFLKIGGPNIFARGVAGEARTPTRPSWRPTDLFADQTKNKRGVLSGGVPIRDGEALGPESGVFRSVTNITYGRGKMNVRTGKQVKSFRFSTRKGSSKTGRPFSPGDMVVRYVSKHPGRLPAFALRDMILSFGEFEADGGLPGAVLESLQKYMEAGEPRMVMQEHVPVGNRRMDVPGFEHRFAGYRRAGGTFMPLVDEMVIVLHGRLKIGRTRK